MKPNLVTDGYEWTTGYINAWNGYYNGSKELNSSINNIVPYSDSWYRELARRSQDPSLERVRINDAGKYEYFGNTDWTKAFYKDVNYSHEHNLSISGGGKNADYYVSGRFYDQDGIYRVGDERYKQYNVRAKGNVRIRPWLRLNNNMDFAVVDYHQPMLYYSNQLVPRMIEHSGQPVSLITNPDGTWTYAAVLNGYAGFAEGTSYQQEDKFTLKDKLGVEIDLVKDVLKVSGDLSYLYSRNTRERVTNMYTGYTGPSPTYGQRKPGQHARKRPLRHELHFEQHLRRIYPQAWRRPFAQVAGRLEPREEKVPYADYQARRAYRAFETEFRPDGRRDERPCGRGLRLELCRCFLPRELWLQGPVPCRVQLPLRRVVEVPREFEVGFLPLGLGGLAPLGGKVHGLV